MAPGLSEWNEAQPLPVLRRHPRCRGIHRTSLESGMSYRVALDRRGIVASMSRTSDCWDAVAESFFGTLKAELVDDEQYASRAAALASIAITSTRLQFAKEASFLDYVSLIEFELEAQTAALAA
jgi:putative transposase